MGINTFVCNKGALGYGAFAWKDGPDVRHIKGASGWGSCGRAEHPLKKQGLRGAPGMNALWALGAELGDTEQLLQEQKAVGCSTRSGSGRVFPGLGGEVLDSLPEKPDWHLALPSRGPGAPRQRFLLSIVW